MNLKIAVTGSSGFIGTALIGKLAERNTELLILRRPEGRNSPDVQRSNSSVKSVADKTSTAVRTEKGTIVATEVLWDPVRGVRHPEQLEGLDAMVHLAGRSIGTRRWSAAEKQHLRDSRVQSTSRLVEQLCELTNRPKLFLSASAIGIYGNTGDHWVTEASGHSQDFLGQLTFDWEQASLPLTEKGVRVAHARFGIVLSASGGALKKMLPIFRWGLGGVLGNGQQYVSWISLEDCCRALLHIIDHTDCSGPLNFVSPDVVTNRQFTKSLGQALGRPTVLFVPAFALRLGMGEMAEALLLSSCRVRPERLGQSGFKFLHNNLEAFLLKQFEQTE